MAKRMLIDSTQPEETRVVVVDGNRLEDFDFESTSKKQLKGNIYLARVTRVEPSLQAAFVEYGGNRHGFLAFSEIHPDYYRLPIEDREALENEEEPDDEPQEDEVSEETSEQPEDQSENPEQAADEAGKDAEGDASAEADDDDVPDDGDEGGVIETDDEAVAAMPESVGGEPVEELQAPRRRFNRRYKIQEVIARRQIMLIQVVKEERGNKGAALTTYLSLAGRYCVLMPNTPKGGGVSRKITNIGDRKRLKTVVEGLDVPEGAAVIVRTAGSERTKTEIKRDYEYLMRLWDGIREGTLESTAPCLIHEEGNLVKRSIRDLYARDISEVLVEGENGYRTAKNFMKTLIPSHAKRVQKYESESSRLFQRYQVENQLDAIHSPTVQLKSGGYIVLNQTEALVSIDVNSGRATRERNIEETALKTNLEAADEVARQLRLRDLAGLVVIDFIDMEESRNQHAVERRMKDAMKHDRARIQLGRISHFGLMELSRQRLRPSLFEASTQVCPHCNGTGFIRSTENAALHLLRVIEEEGMRQRSDEILVHIHSEVALYILNYKREALAQIEEQYGFKVFLEQDNSLTPPDHKVERLKSKSAENRKQIERPIEEAADVNTAPPSDDGDEDERPGRRRRRRRRGGDRNRGDQDRNANAENDNDGEQTVEAGEGRDAEGDSKDGDGEDNGRRRRRRGKRGGRKRSRNAEAETETLSSEPAQDLADSEQPEVGEAADGTDPSGDEQEDKPRRRRSRRSRGRRSDQSEAVAADGDTAAVEETAPGEAAPEAEGSEAPEQAPQEEKPKRRRRSRAKTAEPEESTETAESGEGEAAAAPAEDAPEKPKRTRRRKPAAKQEAETVETAAPEAPAQEAEPAESRPVEQPAAEPIEQPVVEQPAAEQKEQPVAQAPVLNENPMIQVETVENTKDKPKRGGWWNRIVS